MKVILQRDIPKLGKGGDIVNVADGYARNYLFPRNYAVPATGGFLKHHEARLEYERKRGIRQHTDAERNAATLADKTVVLTGRVGSGTKLYGSITAQDIAEAIKSQLGVEVDKRRVGLVDPIKSLGTYTVPVRLGHDVTVNVHVEVTTEEELAQRSADASVGEPQTGAEEAE